MHESDHKYWISKEPSNLPDFIIGGAMKCGTSTLHNALAQHPQIFIPKREVNFFDLDNILQHPDFNFFEDKRWYYADMSKNFEKLWQWYFEKFVEGESKIIGEDSTTYLASGLAAKRIGAQKKKIKMVFVLRQPTLRAYSNYYHLLKSGRAVLSFEESLRLSPHELLTRSLYKTQLEEYFKNLDRDQIKVVLFEEMILNLKETLEDVVKFLGLDPDQLPVEAFKVHSNPSKLPDNIGLYLKRNQRLRKYSSMVYQNYLPIEWSKEIRTVSFKQRFFNKIHRTINPLKTQKPPKINSNTKLFLDRYFRNELEGLDELVGMDILSKWFND